MSKISYCSLEEAWGPSISKNVEKDKDNNTKKMKKIKKIMRKLILLNQNLKMIMNY